MTVTNATVSTVPQLLTTKDAARLLGVSHRTLEDWRLKGGGPRYILVGRRLVRYRISELKLFLDRPDFGNTGEARLAA